MLKKHLSLITCVGIVTFGVFVCAIPRITKAQPAPTFIVYSGLLKDNSGKPVKDGIYKITFKIYDSPTVKDPVWEETQNVNTVKGIFKVSFGYQEPKEMKLYLELLVEGEVTSQPRERLFKPIKTKNVKDKIRDFNPELLSKISENDLTKMQNIEDKYYSTYHSCPIRSNGSKVETKPIKPLTKSFLNDSQLFQNKLKLLNSEIIVNSKYLPRTIYVDMDGNGQKEILKQVISMNTNERGIAILLNTEQVVLQGVGYQHSALDKDTSWVKKWRVIERNSLENPPSKMKGGGLLIFPGEDDKNPRLLYWDGSNFAVSTNVSWK